MRMYDWDESLAFTALLEQDPSFKSLTSREGSARVNRLLMDWYSQDKIKNLWAFTQHWLALGQQHGPEERKAANALQVRN